MREGVTIRGARERKVKMRDDKKSGKEGDDDDEIESKERETKRERMGKGREIGRNKNLKI